ncbi:MAG: YhdP family protein [Gallionella sp.]|nr:YhdP family protein [Gallionella sp.]
MSFHDYKPQSITLARLRTLILMLRSLPVRIIWHSFSWLTRLTVIVSAAMAVLIALAIILLRYWLLPDIELYHDRITAALTKAIGNTVTIGKIESDWQGLQPRLSFVDVHILNEQRQPALALPRIDGSLSWMSLFAVELRLASLEINRPELLIRRDAQGELFIGGMALSKQVGDNNLADWLLHQSHILVRDALIVWVDEQRDAPPLVLQRVNLHIESLFRHHRFALHAIPTAELATPLDVRGDFHGASFGNLDKWHGQIFTQFDFTDVMVWRYWLDLPKEISRGRGALRSWLSVKAGRVTGITADLALYNVVAKLADDAPEMVLSNLHGRAAWKAVAGGFEVSTQKLTMRWKDGTELQPTDIFFRTTQAINNKPATVEVRANLLQVERIASLANYLPLEAGLRAQLEAYSPSGKVANLNVQWQGTLEKPVSYKFKGQFEDIALRQVGAMPGFSGLSLDVDGSDTRGRLNISSHQLVVDAPGVMREPLSFAILTGEASWQRERNELKITLDNTAVVNDDLAGNLYGSYQTLAGTLGVLDLTASLTRGDVRHAARYTPLIALNMEGNDWLNGALLAGHTEDLRIRIKGNLSDFQLGDTEAALLEIGGHARDVVMEFDKNWPRIENIAGEFWIRGNKLEVKSTSATMLGADLRNVTVTLPDMMSDDLPLEINGEAAAENSVFLQFVQQSPVRGYIDGFTDGVRASGNGHLDLFVHIPLLVDKPVKVSGTFRVHDSDIDLGEGVPWLRKTRGELSFTESGMQASGVSAEILGGPASINLQTAKNGVVHATVQGRSSVDVLRKINPHPVLNYLHGGTAWDADIVVEKKSAQLVINSNLQGLSSSLPLPFAKRANELMPLRVEKRNIAEGQDLITARLGSLLDARLERRDKNGAMIIRRGTVNFGGQDKLADTSKAQKRPSGAKLPAKPLRSKNGIWLAGNLPELSIQGWEGLMGGSAKSGMAFPIAGANLHIEKLTGYGQIVNSLQIDATRRGDGLAARLASNALNGEVTWLPHGYEKGGKFSAHLSNLYWVKDEQPEQSSLSDKPDKAVPPEKSAKTAMLRPGKLPALEIVVENLQVADRQFGRFELVGHPDGNDWRLRRLNITNPDGSLTGDGVWHSAQENTQTRVNLQLKLSDVGNILARSGYPNTVKNGSGKLAANLSWDGTPDEFNYASLNGTLKLDTGKGRFLKMDPGAGKLLSILSLQALPSHITLDFTDVFSKGFQFDNINGNAAIKDGVINTQDFHIDGSAAKVTLKGSVDLNSETQDLRVRIFPTLGDSVSLISAFAAGPAIGIGTLIVNKILGKPLDKLVSFEYNVSGTWSEPNVVKVVQTPVPYK